MLAQTTPFLFYLIGGYLAHHGPVSMSGGLVAVITAYKDLPGPIKELIDWDQQRQDVQIKYEQVIEQFTRTGMLDPAKQAVDGDPGPPLSGNLVATNLTLIDDSDRKLLDGAALRHPRDPACRRHRRGRRCALAGAGAPDAALRRHAHHRRPRPDRPAGSGDRPPHVGYVGAETYLFPITVRENIALWPEASAAAAGGDGRRARAQASSAASQEAQRAGNPLLDINADWIDFDAAGVEGRPDSRDRSSRCCQLWSWRTTSISSACAAPSIPTHEPELAAAS